MDAELKKARAAGMLAGCILRPKHIDKENIDWELYLNGPILQEQAPKIYHIYRGQKKAMDGGMWFEVSNRAMRELQTGFVGTQLQLYEASAKDGLLPWQETAGRSDFPQLKAGLRMPLKVLGTETPAEYEVVKTCYGFVQYIGEKKTPVLVVARHGLRKIEA